MELITIKEVKMFCRIYDDDDYEDDLLKFLIESSIDYLKSRLGLDDIPSNIKIPFKMCCLRLINENYNNRDFYLSSNKNKVSMKENLFITSMINEMSYKIGLMRY